MPNNKPKDNNFIAQAGILAVAGIISRIIGLLYRSPLHGIIGDLGMGYYQTAYTYYVIVLLVSSYSIPSAVSKVIAQKLGAHQYKNAHRMFRCALMYVLVVGGLASLALYFGAGLIVADEAVPVLRIFAPTIFVYGILGVIRGYFQAHKTMVQTSVSQILEQIANAVVSVGAAYLMIKAMCGTLDVPEDTAGQVARATYGAMGSAIGTGVGVLVGLLFMAWVYYLNKGRIDKRIRNDKTEEVESYKVIFKQVLLVVTPFILSTAIYNFSDTVNTSIYTDIYPRLAKLDPIEISTNWGIFSGQALTISNIPIAFASAMAAAMIPSISQLIVRNDKEGARDKIGVATKTTMLISIPCAIGLLVLSEPIINLLFHNSAEVLEYAGYLLMALAPSVILYALSTLNSSILQGLGKVNTPIIHAGIALVLKAGVMMGLLMFTKLDLYSIAIGNAVYSLTMCILNQWAVRKAVGYRQEVTKTFVITGVAAVVMGAAAWGIYGILFYFTKSMTISVLPAILIAVVLYFVLLLLFGAVDEEELRGMPKGHVLVRVARKMHLLK